MRSDNRPRAISSAGDFAAAFDSGARYRAPSFGIYVRRNGLAWVRTGLVCRKGIGSVKRNRLRRVFKEALRLADKDLKPGVDMVFSIRAYPGLKALAREMREVFNEMGLYGARNRGDDDSDMR